MPASRRRFVTDASVFGLLAALLTELAATDIEAVAKEKGSTTK
jgi:hypothetical protein